jgi:hypothetical protein
MIFLWKHLQKYLCPASVVFFAVRFQIVHCKVYQGEPWYAWEPGQGMIETVQFLLGKWKSWCHSLDIFGHSFLYGPRNLDQQTLWTLWLVFNIISLIWFRHVLLLWFVCGLFLQSWFWDCFNMILIWVKIVILMWVRAVISFVYALLCFLNISWNKSASYQNRIKIIWTSYQNYLKIVSNSLKPSRNRENLGPGLFRPF